MKFFGKLYTKKRGKQSECNSDNLSMEEIEKDKKTKEVENPNKVDEKNEKGKDNDLINIEAPSEEAQLEEAEETVKKQSTKKKKISSLIGMLINIAVVAGILAYQLTQENMEVASFSTLISNINWGIFLLVPLCFILVMFLETAKLWLVSYKTTKTNRPALAYKVASLGRYYDSITPLASGGQPFQILYMTKRGISGSDSLSICMGKYVIQQIAYLLFSFVVMIFSITMTASSGNIEGTVVTATSWIGFSLNALLIFIIALISINKTIGNKLVGGVLKLLHKMKIVKNYEKQYAKIQKSVNDYQTTMKRYAKDKGTFFSMFFISILYLVAHYSLPFLIHASFYGFHFELYGEIFIYVVMVDLAASFFPLPGGTGASELSFSVLFSSLFGIEGNLFWALLIWRFFTYYIYILQGLALTIYDYLIGNKKFEWTKKRWALEAESRAFEEKELKEFEESLQKSTKKRSKKWF